MVYVTPHDNGPPPNGLIKDVEYIMVDEVKGTLHGESNAANAKLALIDLETTKQMTGIDSLVVYKRVGQQSREHLVN